MTGVQTCALPISSESRRLPRGGHEPVGAARQGERPRVLLGRAQARPCQGNRVLDVLQRFTGKGKGKQIKEGEYELSPGMTPMETKATIELIRKLKGMVTIIIIEHDINMVFAVSDRILVMDQGNVLADGPPEEVKANEAVKAAYFGEEI